MPFLRYCVLGFLLFSCLAFGAEPEKGPTPIASLQPLQGLIGSWRASGVPEGSTEEKQKGHWTETIDWSWKFKDKDCWLEVMFNKGKYFTRGEIRPGKEASTFQFKLDTTSKETWLFQGTLKDKQLIFERTDEQTKDLYKLVIALLHDNRITYRMEVKGEGKTFAKRLYQVGATKEGEAFASIGVSERECVVSGGTGTSTVTFNGKTYYVCCSGCRDEFKANPEKYVTEFEKKRAASEKKK